MSNFLLGFDTESYPDKRLREYVWQRQEVNAPLRIIVTADHHTFSRTYYWYWVDCSGDRS